MNIDKDIIGIIDSIKRDILSTRNRIFENQILPLAVAELPWTYNCALKGDGKTVVLCGKKQNNPPFFWLKVQSEDKGRTNEGDFPKTSQRLPKDIPITAARTFELIKQNPCATVAQLAVEEGVSDRTIKAHIALLKENGIIKRDGGKSKGLWIVIADNE